MGNIEHERFEILYELYDRWTGIPLDGVMLTELAAWMGLTLGEIQSCIDDLEDRGFVTRACVTGEVAITQAGINLIEVVLDHHPKLNPKDPLFEIS